MAESLSPDYIEHIHDFLVDSFLPWDETVGPDEYRNRALIESAAARPFQSAFGEEAWPALSQKAAALFHSLACNHCFLNGNKRTAVIGLDLFLAVNGHLLVLNHGQVYELAKHTAKANQQGRSLDTVLQELAQTILQVSLRIEDLRSDEMKEKLGANYVRVMLRMESVLNMAEHIRSLQTS